MTFKDLPVKQARLPESAQIWDNSDHQFITAYRKDFKRQKTIKLINAITFNDVTTSKTGISFEVPAYANALILIKNDVTNSPTDFLITIQFSDNNVDWYDYVMGPFGDLRYVTAQGDLNQCLELPVLAPFMRAKIVATGTTSSATFKITLKALLNG
ncbi:hypothetical protein LCGC14_0807850 [marine sediment metagenome]|uniref:F5/8 type C domain-containing protein n=1 Tax=marine sediment metagenome TaxID=412755 RepID=A0A0F9S7N2_9ZZZZ